MVTKRISGVLSDVDMCSLRVVSLKIFFANFFSKFVTGPAKINHVSIKNCQFFSSLLYHNLLFILTK